MRLAFGQLRSLWCGVVWCRALRCNAVRGSALWCGAVLCDVVRCGALVWCGHHHPSTTNCPEPIYEFHSKKKIRRQEHPLLRTSYR